MKRIPFFILICFICLTFTGCWGKTELNELSLVTTIGIDKAQDGRLQVSVLVVTPTGGAQMVPTEKSNVWLGTATGSSMLEAMRNLNKTATKKLVWYDNRLIIISADAARQNLREISDFFARSRDTRFVSKVLITEGNVLDLLQLPADTQKSLPAELDGVVKNAPEWSEAYIPGIKEFMSNLSDKLTDTLAGRIVYYNSSRDTYSTNREEYRKQYWLDREFGITEISGSSVIKYDRFVGFLDGIETRGALWVMNKVKNGVITADTGGENGKLVMDFRKGDSDITPNIEDNRITMNVKLKIKGDLAETTGNYDFMNEKDIKEIEAEWENVVVHEMELAQRKVQKEYQADIFGFAGHIKRKYPEIWRKIEKDWDNIYPDIQVKFDVKVILSRFGKTSGLIVETG